MAALSSADTIKIVILVSAFVAIYALSRWASRHSESLPPSPEMPRETAKVLPLEAPREWPKVVPINVRPQFARTEVVDESALLPVRIVKFYFSRFDVIPGPPDPAAFADEVFVELYDENSGYQWTNSYFVATARGIQQMLEDEHWQYAFADQTFFVRRYDAQAIRQMIVEQLINTQERPKPPKEEDLLI
jgi:hypothetical protein